MHRFGKVVLYVSLAAAMAGMWAETAQAAYRQYFTAWAYHEQRDYHYRTWYFKPTEQTSGYRHHYCLYFPTRPKYVYWYDPTAKQFWGRYELSGKEGARFSVLKPEDRATSIDAIAEDSFPAAGPMPALPDSTDGVPVDPLPSLPEGVTPPGPEEAASPNEEKPAAEPGPAPKPDAEPAPKPATEPKPEPAPKPEPEPDAAE
ncbi:MAG: hypothetical protein KDA79_07850 [Planctomycetaceae bacterium]|nr:hypothetical protein [Planctomycetaceae bacterium]